MNVLKTPEQSLSLSEFKRLAQEIPSDPMDRLPEHAASIFSEVIDPSMPSPSIFVDAHMHAFTYKNIPEDFLQYDKWLIGTLRRAAVGLLRPTFMKSIEADSPLRLVKRLLRRYFSSPYHHYGIEDTFLILLMMDMERGIGGRIREPFHEQVDEVCRTLKEVELKYRGHEFQGEKHLLPFLAIDPHNPDVFKYFLSAFIKEYNTTPSKSLDHSAPFQGVKVYPALGYAPHHPTLMEIFEICEEKRIPVTTHTGGYRTHPSYDAVDADYRKKTDTGWEDKSKRLNLKGIEAKKFARFFLDPTHWKDQVLSQFPNLKLNLAHFGNNEEWRKYRDNEHSVVHRTLNTIHAYDKVYADLSYTFYNKRNLEEIYQLMDTDEQIHARVLYGSDFYLCEVEKGNVKEFYEQVYEVMENREVQKKLFYENAIHFLCD